MSCSDIPQRKDILRMLLCCWFVSVRVMCVCVCLCGCFEDCVYAYLHMCV